MVIIVVCQVTVLICFLQLLLLELLQIHYTFNYYVVSLLSSTLPCITLHADHVPWIYMKQTVATCRILKGNCWNVLWIPKNLWTTLQIAVKFWKLLLTAGKWRKRSKFLDTPRNWVAQDLGSAISRTHNNCEPIIGNCQYLLLISIQVSRFLCIAGNR